MEFLQVHKFDTKSKILILFFCFLFSFTLCSKISAQKKYVVVLDAGHGGGDPGKVGYRKYREKDIALKITLKIGSILQKNKDIKVIYTRKKDVFVDLWKRGDIANKANADLFVSIHCNAHHTQAYGSETWVLGLHANKKNFAVAKRENAVILLEDNYKEKYKGFNPNSPESVIGLTLMQEDNLDKSLLLASVVQENFSSRLKRINRGVKQAGFVVLHQTYMPSVLIETGFITNKEEAKYLNSRGGQASISISIATAIEKYISQLKLNTVVNTDLMDDFLVTYKVQIASGKNKIPPKSYNFKGLKNIERIKVGSFYKYYYESTPYYDQVKKYLKTAKEKGYTTAYVVAFKDGKKISVAQARKN